MSSEAFDPFVTPVDYIRLNSQRSPGIAKVTGATDKRKWDVQTGYALSGGITIYRGKEISRFTVTLTFTEAQHWIDWATWRKLVARPPNGVRPRAMTIEHPWLSMLDIHEVSVEEVGQPEESDETGAWSVAIKFIEFRLPTPSFAKPDAAKTKEDNDPYSKEIARLTQQRNDKVVRRDQLRVGAPPTP